MTPPKPRCSKCDVAMKKQYERKGADARFVATGDYKCPKCGKLVPKEKL